jgi:hypothetical protein
MPEVIDQWTVRQAWEQVRGDALPPLPEEIKQESLCEIDCVIASYFGDTSLAGRRKAAAAVAYIWPRLMESPLPPGPEAGRPEHIYEEVSKVLIDYCKGEGLTYGDTCGALLMWDLSLIEPDQWFLIWDAMGTSNAHMKNLLLWDFYKLAGAFSRFSRME